MAANRARLGGISFSREFTESGHITGGRTRGEEESMTKRLVLGLAAICVTGAMTLPLAAESFRVKTEIPFAFTIHGKTLPAGEYVLNNNNGMAPAAVVFLTDMATRATTMVLSQHVGDPDTHYPRPGALIFHRYGDQYFLYQVWDGFSNDGFQIPQSRQERQAAQESAGIQPETVVVAAMR
jgi:hypothetical protein